MGIVAPEGSQVGVVQNTGSISQPLTLAAAKYSFKVSAAQAKGNTSSQSLKACRVCQPEATNVTVV